MRHVWHVWKDIDNIDYTERELVATFDDEVGAETFIQDLCSIQDECGVLKWDLSLSMDKVMEVDDVREILENKRRESVRHLKDLVGSSGKNSLPLAFPLLPESSRHRFDDAVWGNPDNYKGLLAVRQDPRASP